MWFPVGKQMYPPGEEIKSREESVETEQEMGRYYIRMDSIRVE